MKKIILFVVISLLPILSFSQGDDDIEITLPGFSEEALIEFRQNSLHVELLSKIQYADIYETSEILLEYGYNRQYHNEALNEGKFHFTEYFDIEEYDTGLKSRTEVTISSIYVNFNKVDGANKYVIIEFDNNNFNPYFYENQYTYINLYNEIFKNIGYINFSPYTPNINFDSVSKSVLISNNNNLHYVFKESIDNLYAIVGPSSTLKIFFAPNQDILLEIVD